MTEAAGGEVRDAKGIVACDFMPSVTASTRVLYFLAAVEVGPRRILQANVTTQPTAERNLEQFREYFTYDHPHRYLIHDRNSVFSAGLDSEPRGFGLRVLKTPVRAPKADAHCERLVGTIQRECLDFLLSLNARHLRRIVGEFVIH